MLFSCISGYIRPYGTFGTNFFRMNIIYKYYTWAPQKCSHQYCHCLPVVLNVNSILSIPSRVFPFVLLLIMTCYLKQLWFIYIWDMCAFSLRFIFKYHIRSYNTNLHLAFQLCIKHSVSFFVSDLIKCCAGKMKYSLFRF